MQELSGINHRLKRFIRGLPTHFAGVTPGGETRFFVNFGQNSPNGQIPRIELCIIALANGLAYAGEPPNIFAAMSSFRSSPA